jgi:hypothetical protein
VNIEGSYFFKRNFLSNSQKKSKTLTDRVFFSICHLSHEITYFLVDFLFSDIPIHYHHGLVQGLN